MLRTLLFVLLFVLPLHADPATPVRDSRGNVRGYLRCQHAHVAGDAEVVAF
jgi:hypothetical protein